VCFFGNSDVESEAGLSADESLEKLNARMTFIGDSFDNINKYGKICT
jgi:hypothetical protein